MYIHVVNLLLINNHWHDQNNCPPLILHYKRVCIIRESMWDNLCWSCASDNYLAIVSKYNIFQIIIYSTLLRMQRPLMLIIVFNIHSKFTMYTSQFLEWMSWLTTCYCCTVTCPFLRYYYLHHTSKTEKYKLVLVTNC